MFPIFSNWVAFFRQKSFLCLFVFLIFDFRFQSNCLLRLHLGLVFFRRSRIYFLAVFSNFRFEIRSISLCGCLNHSQLLHIAVVLCPFVVDTRFCNSGYSFACSDVISSFLPSPSFPPFLL